MQVLTKIKNPTIVNDPHFQNAVPLNDPISKIKMPSLTLFLEINVVTE